MPQPSLDPEFYLHQFDLAKRVFDDATALNSFGAEQHEREADARDDMRCARNVDAPLAVFERPEE